MHSVVALPAAAHEVAVAGAIADPQERFCFTTTSEDWIDEGYDLNSDSIAVRQGEDRLRVHHDAECWLMADLSEAEVREIEVLLYGLGSRSAAVSVAGRHGEGLFVIYAAKEDKIHVIACVPCATGWVWFEGTVEIRRAAEVQGMIKSTDTTCR